VFSLQGKDAHFTMIHVYNFFVFPYLHVLQKSAFTTYIICDTTKTDID